ncbi:MAG: YtxH domain-containing protein [Thermosynechococcaceae cyanobacterium MS004]|nr:YtxH domain-containing protein [Thermosynechococcaceae cyanobacterium MS004]
MSHRRSGLFIGGVLLGTALGTVAGWLSAPRPGRETREILKKSAEALPELAEDLSANLQLQANRLSVSALQRWDDTLDQLKEALNAGIEAANAQRQTLEGIKKEDDAA